MLVSNIKKQLGNKEVLKNITFTLSNNDKVGLVGINGSGKSTLLKILSGEIKQDFGSVKLNEQTVAYLKQEIPYIYNEMSILEYIKQEIGIDKLEENLKKLESNLTEDNMEEYSDILNKFLAIDGYMFEDNLKNTLLGLNLKENIDCKIASLSGGEKIKVLLAIVLIKNADILLLDEPTNNLDLKAIEWLEDKLKSSDKKMIIISHDEVFLNNIVNKIFELSDGTISEYNLSYADYLSQKDIEYNHLKENYLKVQEQRDKLKKQVQKAKEWANKGVNKKAHNDNDKLANNYAKEKTNSANIAKLSKELEELKVPNFTEKKPIKVFFSFDNSKGNKDILLERLVCGYDEFTTPELNLLIPFGTRLNVTGENGSGKTTLLKTIIGQINPVKGEVKLGSGVKIGYISQNTLDSKIEDGILKYLTKENSNIDKSRVFMLLDKFNINYHDKDKSYAILSPGERTRVNLAKIVMDNINVLILDEVTNHLDKEALDLIYELVREYDGTIISISHNRKYNEQLNADIDLDMQTGKILKKSLHKHR